MRVALLSYNARAADAIGNLIAEKLAFFLDRGADARVFVESDRQIHPALRERARVLSPDLPNHDDWRFLVSADLVVVEYGQDYRLLELLPLLVPGKGRIWLDYHGVTPPDLWHPQNRELIEGGVRKRGLVWCADAVVAHSQFAAAELDSTGFPAERLLCLSHPVDTDIFQPAPASQSMSSRLGLGDAAILLFVGRLAPNKRLPVLIEALARLGDHVPHVHAVVIGDQRDLYEMEADRCRRLAGQLGVADRLHLLGQVKESQLLDAYRSADVFVMPSRHEGFCIPAVEAMACSLPVIAARAGALPETVAGAGLTFIPDDADDLARQVRRVLCSDARSPARLAGAATDAAAPSSPRARVAVVSFRYGTDFVGGAESSLRTIAETLSEHGHPVEVFTTCTRAEHDWSNQLPEGRSTVNGHEVRRFPVDPHDRLRHDNAVRSILEEQGPVAPEVEKEYLDHSIHSRMLIDALRTRQDDFEAIIVGPYLHGLTLDVARAFPDKTLLLPCFHDEPFARLPAWPLWYQRVGGILYHSAEEQAFAQTRMGINHPRASCIGGLIETSVAEPAGEPRLAGPYVVYCGRYSAQKSLPVLLEYAGRYQEEHPGRFTFAFMGQGEVEIPKKPGLVDLGFVEERVKRDVLRGASALILLSRYESLSYAALEAWAQGTPVIADARCAVLAGHLGRCGGGAVIGSFDELAGALNDLHARPEHWRGLGARGQEYVRTHHGSSRELARKLNDAIEDLKCPLAGRMRARGLERAQGLDRKQWRERFGDMVEHILDAGPRPYRECVEIKPRSVERRVNQNAGTALAPLRLVNRGSTALLAEGIGRSVLRCRIIDEENNVLERHVADTPLPGLLIPGRAVAVAASISVPRLKGRYRARFEVVRAARLEGEERPHHENGRPATDEEQDGVVLIVEDGPANDVQSCCGPLLESVHAALAEASGRQRLPDDYHDVTQGLFAAWKRRIKRKLLGNFKHAYVDVLSRQQSAFNHGVLTALQELAECCATLDHARRFAVAGPDPTPQSDLARRLEESRQQCAALEQRLARLEARLEAETFPAPGNKARNSET